MTRNFLWGFLLIFFISFISTNSHTEYPPNYKSTTQESIEGEILKLSDFTSKYSILLSTKKGRLVVILGSVNSFKKHNLKLAINDKIKVKGFRQYREGTNPYFIATELSKGQKIYKIEPGFNRKRGYRTPGSVRSGCNCQRG